MTIDDTEENSARNRPGTIKILAVASKGGHWDQLMLLRTAFQDAHLVTFATTDASISRYHEIEECREITEYSQSNPIKVLVGLAETWNLVRRLRPTIVVTTGAAPGLLCLLWGRIYGAHTIWIESVANAETLSLSGRLSCLFSHKTVTQWEHLEKPNRVLYWGSLL